MLDWVDWRKYTQKTTEKHVGERDQYRWLWVWMESHFPTFCVRVWVRVFVGAIHDCVHAAYYILIRRKRTIIWKTFSSIHLLHTHLVCSTIFIEYAQTTPSTAASAMHFWMASLMLSSRTSSLLSLVLALDGTFIKEWDLGLSTAISAATVSSAKSTRTGNQMHRNVFRNVAHYSISLFLASFCCSAATIK